MFVEPAEVLARWAYSDIAGTRAAAYDAAPDIETLRSKRREGVGFHDLARDEREHLEHLCRTVRAPLMKYLDEVQQFVLKPMDRVDLAYLCVPREVEQSDRSMSFAEYACRPQTEQNDARAAQSMLGGYKVPHDPLTVGRQSLLLDGYHRAVTFWWFAGPGAKIDAYVPDRTSRSL